MEEQTLSKSVGGMKKKKKGSKDSCCSQVRSQKRNAGDATPRQVFQAKRLTHVAYSYETTCTAFVVRRSVTKVDCIKTVQDRLMV